MIGRRLNMLRKKKGLTQETLSIIADLPQSAISEIEKGKRKSPSIQMVKRLADALGVTVDDLCD